MSHANLREGLKCVQCGSYNRQRQLLAMLSYEATGKVYPLPVLIKKMKKGTRILLLESVTNLADVISYYAGSRVIVEMSEYVADSMQSGEVMPKTGVMHFDIQNAHYESDRFHYILHADVFEHVSDAVRAEQEQMRILKIGGKALYTAPFHSDFTEDRVCASVIDGKVVHHYDPIYHGDPSPTETGDTKNGCLVFRIFSLPGMKDRYEKMGHTFRCHYLYSSHYGIVGNNGYVFVAEKRARS